MNHYDNNERQNAYVKGKFAKLMELNKKGLRNLILEEKNT